MSGAFSKLGSRAINRHGCPVTFYPSGASEGVPALGFYDVSKESSQVGPRGSSSEVPQQVKRLHLAPGSVTGLVDGDRITVKINGVDTEFSAAAVESYEPVLVVRLRDRRK